LLLRRRYAQTKTVAGETQTVNATVEAIDSTRRGSR
jgi:hypothetical protein